MIEKALLTAILVIVITASLGNLGKQTAHELQETNTKITTAFSVGH